MFSTGDFHRRFNFLAMADSRARGQKKWMIYFLWVSLCALVFWKPVYSLFQLASRDETASHILLIPFISAWLIYTGRKQLPVQNSFDFRASLLFFVPALLTASVTLRCESCASRERLSGFVVSLILFLISGFIAILGKAAAKSAWFALAFLLFAVPIPEPVQNMVIYRLQSGSAAVAEVLFDLSGAPVLREGLIFRLSTVTIEVAQECSGIRSSLALLILALLLAHFAFRSFWKKAVFVTAGLLMMLIKNGIRIAALTLLANYVNPDFLYGKLHHRGGIAFFLIGFALLLPVYWLLRRGETIGTPGKVQSRS
jgi:exosortase